MNKKMIGAVMGLAFVSSSVAMAEEKKAEKKEEKKADKKDEKKAGGEKSCGGAKSCGGEKK